MRVATHTFLNTVLMRPLEVWVLLCAVHALFAFVVVVLEGEALGGAGAVCIGKGGSARCMSVCVGIKREA